MAKTYLDVADATFTISNNNVTAYGQSGEQTIILSLGATALIIDQNVERVIFSQALGDYTYEQVGNQLRVYQNGALAATIPAQDDSDGSRLSFSDGDTNIMLTGGIMKLGGAKPSGSSMFDSKLVALIKTPIPAHRRNRPNSNSDNPDKQRNLGTGRLKYHLKFQRKHLRRSRKNDNNKKNKR